MHGEKCYITKRKLTIDQLITPDQYELSRKPGAGSRGSRKPGAGSRGDEVVGNDSAGDRSTENLGPVDPDCCLGRDHYYFSNVIVFDAVHKLIS